ncbi:serine--tRNA ligase [Candidatus Curtissbacteria bacterium RIFCSPHIGHO2_02_FULL_40_17]|uniref:Serine--tRNA ligase n=3 Tax=Candidatus Curtissiibacteriota TaxID=1752717 RepID=A0A1F5GIG9_9BACT|nr:MAG: serine--tRNA ligase [Candidatus Curtissbacteria bacterium RIFCSPHIGHO2_01_FULL_40_12]OGD91652.1 MAG: serine--tRNA ligase [Candidatus Curtissbacteria bacterium RIFCSPHIGHO2_02_FULL_40_17]OGE04528.1 MAG: serine--tRNA ligase [Candidatus Curtissbacteria bacterium RIFCSPHIGHO2_12_FULL_41_17]
MLDIKFIRDNPKLVEEKAKQKGFPIDLKKLLTVDEKRKKLIEEVDHLRSKRKEAAEKRDEKIGSKLKKQLHLKEDTLEGLNEEFYKLIRQVPNLPKDDVLVGASEKDNQVVRVGGKKPSFDFKPKDHLDLGLTLDLIDVERAAKISGTRFSYIKNELVSLEFAIIKFTIDLLTKEGFTSIIPPVIINPKVVEGLGYPEYLTGEGYKVDDQYLTGTAEHSIVPMHMDEVFAEEDLPKRYVGFSTAFRREAGSYGKDTKGIFRLHQFDKVEMVSYVLPKDEGKELQYLVSLQEKMVKELDLPYRLLLMCTGELGFPIAKKYDIEIWLPSQEKYRETHSASTTSDFQARRLNIKYRSNKETGFLYTLNATAFAIGRTLIAILENYQQKDGSILIPKALQKYAGFTKIPAK